MMLPVLLFVVESAAVSSFRQSQMRRVSSGAAEPSESLKLNFESSHGRRRSLHLSRTLLEFNFNEGSVAADLNSTSVKTLP